MFNIAFDCGGSRLRYISDTSTNNQVVKRPTAYGVIPIDTPIIPEVGVKSEEMIIKRNEEDPVRIVKGDALQSYKAMTYGINHVDLKVNTPCTYYNILYGIVKTYLQSPINEPLKIGVCLPPVEVFGGYAKHFKETLAGTYTVTFPFIPERTISFEILEDNILVQPEGACARTQIPEDQMSCFKFLTLICDIGYRSLDLILMQNGKPVRSLTPSYPHGGHNMESELQQLLSRHNIFCSKDEISEAMYTGTVQNRDVIKAINTVKSSFSMIVYDDIVTMIGGLPEYNLQSVRYLVLIGRPLSKPDVFGIDDLSSLIVSKFPWMEGITVPNLEEANVLGVYQSLQKWKEK